MLDVTANDIANVNTIGYKAERTSFKDALSQLQRGASAPTATLGGTERRADRPRRPARQHRQPDDRRRDPVDGQPARLAIQGDGFFRVTDDPTTLRHPDLQYTRAGNFTTRRQRRPRDAGRLLRRRLQVDSSGNPLTGAANETKITIPAELAVRHDRPGRHRHDDRLRGRRHQGGRHLAGASSRTTPGLERVSAATTGSRIEQLRRRDGRHRRHERPRHAHRRARSRCRTSTSPRSSPT